MTNVVFIIVFIGLAIASAAFLPLGLMTWVWIALQSPQQLVQVEFPANLIIVLCTIVAIAFNRRPFKPARSPLLVIGFLFVFHTFITTQFSVLPLASEPLFDRLWKTCLLVLFISFYVDNRTRIHALAATIAASIGFLAIKGALFSIVTGGAARVFGPRYSQIADNNHFGVAIVMTIPFCVYMAEEIKSKAIRTGLIVAAALIPLAAMFTHSRTATVCLAVLAACYWTLSRRKIMLAAVAVTVLVLAFPYMPESWTDRMATIADTTEGRDAVDESVQGRYNSWEAHWTMAMRRPLIGGGFRTIEQMSVWQTLHPGLTAHAAHNSFFQVLGEHGFPGLFIYLMLLVGTLFSAYRTRRRLSYVPELRWAYNLSTAIFFSTVAYAVGGLALSLAYYDFFYILVGMTVCLNAVVTRTISSQHTGGAR